LPLTNTAVPASAATGTTATFTRATTATVQNNDGYLVQALSGEARFQGARRVRNLLTFTEDFSNAAWVKPTGCTIGSNVVANPINGALTADKIIPPVSASFHSVYQSYSLSGATHNYSIYLKNAGYNFAYISPDGGTSGVTINLTTGATTTTGSVTAAATSVGNGWWRVSCLSSVTTNTIRVYPGSTTAPESFTGDGTSGIYAWGAQLEDVTAQTTQTAGEYVSVGVTSAPYYHGSFVDGVKCFATDLSGNPIPSTTLLGYSAEGARTNLCLQSNAFTTTWVAYLTPSATQNVIGPDGATSAWTLTDNDPADVEEIYQDIAITAAAHTFSVFVKKTTGAQSSYPALRWFIPGLTECAACTIDTTNGVATAWTAITGFAMASGVSASCVSFNSNFWRVSLTKTGTAATHRIELLPAATANATQSTGSFSAAVQGSAVFYGAQVELGSFASSYIATTTIAVARNADVLTYSSAGNINTAEGTAYAELSTNWSTSPTTLIALAASADQIFSTASEASTSIRNSDGATGLVKTGLTDMRTGARKRSVSWSVAGNRRAITGDGVAVTTGAFDGTMGNTAIYVGASYLSTAQWDGTIRNVRIWQRALSSSELQAVTA